MRFTEAERSHIKAQLIQAAREDASILSAVVFGSAARGAEDAWSDIDLGFRLAPGEDVALVCNRWTESMSQAFGLASTLDIWAQGALYRVFLLDSTLQVDLSFWPYESFTIEGPHYELLFGEAHFAPAPAVNVGQIIGMGWLYILHARSYICRGRPWQALLMLEALRNQIFMLKCHRHGLAYYKGLGIDRLPPGEAHGVGSCMPASRGTAELARAFEALCTIYMQEVGLFSEAIADQLKTPVSAMQEEIAAI